MPLSREVVRDPGQPASLGQMAEPITRPVKVPAAHQALTVLAHLGRQAGPVPAAAIARDLGLPRSTTYQLLATLAATGFVVHLVDERRWAWAWRPTSSAPATSGRPRSRGWRGCRLARLVDRVGQSAHLVVLHGREVIYVIEERAPGRPSLVTDVGVRLPAQLTASGRAMLAALPAAQVRALFPGPDAFVTRHEAGPRVDLGAAAAARRRPPHRPRGRGRRGDAGLRVGGGRRARPRPPSGGGRGRDVPVRRGPGRWSPRRWWRRSRAPPARSPPASGGRSRVRYMSRPPLTAMTEPVM